MTTTCWTARMAALLWIGLLLVKTASGTDAAGTTNSADLGRESPSLFSAASLFYRAFIDHLAAGRRSLGPPDPPPGEGRTIPVTVRPVTFGEGLWIFGGSVAFSLVKVLGLSLLYLVAPDFVERWGPTFG